MVSCIFASALGHPAFKIFICVVFQPFKFNHDAFGLSVLTIKGSGEEQKDGGKENSMTAAGGGAGLAEFKKKVQNVGSPAAKPARMTNTLQVADRTVACDDC